MEPLIVDMSEIAAPLIDPSLRPDSKALAFDLDNALASIVSLTIEAPEQAFTAKSLGTQRAGHGVIIGSDGLVLTIGYLIVEAQSIWVVDYKGRAFPGHVVGYDHETGFGLVQILGRTEAPVMQIGQSSKLKPGGQVVVAGHGGQENAINAVLAARQEFAGYWEYLIDDALFTAPPHPFWGGAALIGPDGRLCGIGSLFVQENPDVEGTFDGNMIVPIDLLAPILDDLRMYGRPQRAARPWLGAMTAENEGRIVVVGLWENGPAAGAGLEPGDLIVGVGDSPMSELADMLRTIWSLGPAGTEVPLNVLRTGRLMTINIPSADRAAFQITPDLH